MNRQCYTVLPVFLLWSLAFMIATGFAAPPQKTSITILSPSPGSHAEIIAKKPEITFAVSGEFQTETLLVLLDSTDITGLVRITGDGLIVTPVTILPPGRHSLQISVSDMNGNPITKNAEFSTRHSKLFREAVVQNELSMMYEGVLTKQDNPGTPYSKIESNLNNMTTLTSDKWRYSLKTNMRYLDQSLPVFSPQKKGIDFADYLFRADYQENTFSASVEAGNITVDQSINTLSGLVREGNSISLGWQGYKIKGFMLSTNASFGFNEDLYQDKKIDYRITGLTGETNLFSDTLTLKTFYVRGDEPGESFGSWDAGGDKSGHVMGISAISYLFDRRTALQAEFDLSDYDPDQSDAFSSETDKAYRLSIQNMFDKYTVGALYSYMGPDYAVIGNAYMPNNRQEIAMNTGATFTEHTLNLSATRAHDNVEKEDLFPRYTSSQFMIDYGFNKFRALPLKLTFNKAIMKSSLEPEFTTPSHSETDTWTASANYMKGPYNLNVQTCYSFQNDRVTRSNDTKSLTVSFNPSYNKPLISIAPGLSFIQTEYEMTHVKNDTYSANLNLRSELIERKMTCDLSGTISQTKADDDSTDTYSLNANTRLSYILCESYWRMIQPTVALVGRYNKTRDKNYDTKFSESAVMVVVTNALAFSL